MTVRETAHVFAGGGESLVGVISHAAGRADTALLVVVGGPQYRVGSHRQFVGLARAVAAAGCPVLRFDYRGMGDASGEARGFEAVSDDIGAAIDLLFAELPGLRRVLLWGLCDGASAALLYCHDRRDPRVGGLCLLNPWVRSAATLARTHVRHYYLQRLLQPGFWRRLWSGKVAWNAVAGLVADLRTSRASGQPAAGGSSYQQRMAQAWRDGARPILLLLSEDDHTAQEFVEATRSDPAWHGALQRPGLRQHTVAGADHTFSAQATKREVERLTGDWCRGLAGRRGA